MGNTRLRRQLVKTSSEGMISDRLDHSSDMLLSILRPGFCFKGQYLKLCMFVCLNSNLESNS